MPEKKNEKPYISNSQLGMYERCGEQYRRRYLENEIIPPGIAAVKGFGVHDGARGNFRQKKDSQEDLPKKDIIELAVAGFEQSIGKGVLLTPDEQSIGYQKVVDTAKDGVVGLAGLFADEVAPQYQPVYVEERHRIMIPGSTHDLLAVMDLADIYGQVVDLKTTSRAKKDTEADESEQLTFYALVFKALTGDLPSKVVLEILIDKKSGTARQQLPSSRTDEDIRSLLYRINTMLRGLEAGVFMPASTSHWLCDPRWCGYYMTCPYVSKRGR